MKTVYFKAAILCILSGCFAVSNLNASTNTVFPGTVAVKWDRAVLGVGSLNEFSITVQSSDAEKITELLAVSNTLDVDLQIERDSASLKNRIVYRGRLQNFEVKDLLFPGFELRWVSGGQTNRMAFGTVLFRVVPPGISWKKKPPIRDIKPLQPYENGFPFWVVAAVVGILIAISAIVIISRLRKKQKKYRKTEDPWQSARKALHGFELDHMDSLLIKNFYFSVSELLRECLQIITGLPFLESTTSGCRPLAEKVVWLSETNRTELLQLLKETDPVKYAKYLPGRDELEQERSRVLAWLERSELDWRAWQNREEVAQ